MADDRSEVGAGWKKESKKGEKYLSLSLDMTKLLKASGGAISGKVNLGLFAKKGEKTNPKQPDYSLLYFPPRDGARPEPTTTEDDSIPF